ncbi:AAA family ATPase [Desulfobotulus mexicanus]|uniref:AAA family ATPase n=1 Tax=Desulfobotulus mexicanus TaxID=2586642 RepID=A0A5S5MDV8_9BACT|nr:AAA family ATPase [Desulfobotulus mexicanus]TYT73892.1 AAA family ATPase [Desulfobotulus mexicanus]
MRIDSLLVKNFKGFGVREFFFHPEFNLIVGMNGTGKTSVLDAVSVAVGSWFLGVRGADTRHIRPGEVLLRHFEHEEMDEEGHRHCTMQWDRVYPCEVFAQGHVQEQSLSWSRSLNAPGGRTTYGSAAGIKELAAEADEAIRKGQDILLPLISYYGTGRLWQEPREAFTVSDPMKVANKEEQSRLAGYWNSVDPRLSVSQLTRWIARQSWISYQQQNRISPVFSAVKEALVSCVEDARNLDFDATLGEVVVGFPGGTQPFSNLSDGQRCMLAMVGDIAHKAAKLNPQLGSRVLRETPGVVLIDELDLHLHPRWQRRVIEDLRRTFPKIQFICTTHSPFLIQSLRSGEELLMLDGQPTAALGNLSLEEIARGIQQVANPQVSHRYEEMKGVARNYLETLEEAAKAPKEALEDFRVKLAEPLAPYADNPAFQAFLEMKRAAKLGE